MKLYSFTFLVILLLPYPSIGQTLSNGLTAHFNFDGNLFDDSPLANDLEILDGAAAYAGFTDTDSTLVVDGASRFSTTVPFDNSDFEATAISFCFKTSSITPNLQIMLQGAFMGFGVYIKPNEGKVIGFFDTSSSGSIESLEVVTDDQWHHVVVQSDGNETSMYIDGVFNGSKEEPMIVGSGGITNRLFIGLSNQGVLAFDGQLNDIRIYNRTLTEMEIQELSSKLITVSLSDNDFKQEDQLTIYPNPTRDFITIAPEDNYAYRVFNLNGQQVLNGMGTSIDVGALEAGKYIIIINDRMTKTFIKH